VKKSSPCEPDSNTTREKERKKHVASLGRRMIAKTFEQIKGSISELRKMVRVKRQPEQNLGHKYNLDEMRK